MGKIKALFGQIVDIFYKNPLPQCFHFGIDLVSISKLPSLLEKFINENGKSSL